MPTLNQAAQLQIAIMLASGVEPAAIAKLCNCSRITVDRLSTKLRQNIDSTVISNQYQRLALEQAPLDKRVSVLARNMDPDVNPFAQLKAVEYCDKINKLVDYQQDTDKQDVSNRPIFSLQQVQINVGCDQRVEVSAPDDDAFGLVKRTGPASDNK